MNIGTGRLRRWLITAAVAATALGSLAVAGCDDDDETTTIGGATGATGGAGAQATIDVSETEYALDPANPTVPAGTVTIEVTNDGQVAHNLEVEGPTGEEELEQDLQAGDSGTLEVDLSEPGKYEWYCPVANHRDLGMEGEITAE